MLAGTTGILSLPRPSWHGGGRAEVLGPVPLCLRSPSLPQCSSQAGEVALLPTPPPLTLTISPCLGNLCHLGSAGHGANSAQHALAPGAAIWQQ